MKKISLYFLKLYQKYISPLFAASDTIVNITQRVLNMQSKQSKNMVFLKGVFIV